MKLEIQQIGNKEFYEDYHNQYIWGDTIIATSHYDPKQELHVCREPKNQKWLYAKTPEGIKQKLEKLLTLKSI